MQYHNEDLWKLAFVLALGAIILLIFVALVLTPASTIVYIGESNIFDGSFKQPFEILYLVFYNGDCLSFSTYQKSAIPISAGSLNYLLEGRNRKLEDVAIMVHNHLAMPRFSDGNYIFLKRLRGLGFKGSFCIYVTSSGRVVCDRLPNN